jgi:rubrerythrin
MHDPDINWQSRAEAAEDRVRALEALVYAPGRWRCAKCKFTLLQSNLNANTGTVTSRDAPGDKCPNCDAPLWRVSWKQEAEDNLDIAERIHAEKMAAEEKIRNGR